MTVIVIATGLSRGRPVAAPLTFVHPSAGLRNGTDILVVALAAISTPGGARAAAPRIPVGWNAA